MDTGFQWRFPEEETNHECCLKEGVLIKWTKTNWNMLF